MTWLIGILCTSLGLFCPSTPLVENNLGAFAPISVPAGGTGWVSFQSGTLLTGNGSSRLSTTSVGSGLSLAGGVLSATGGSGNVSTSTTPTIGQLPYWTTSGDTPELLGSVATTTLTASSPLSLSNTVAKVGGSNSVLTLDTSGDWTGTLDGFNGFGYLFPSNATTTGLGIYASSTIGNGTQSGGLTISGGATTTGNLNLNSDQFIYLRKGAANSAIWHDSDISTTGNVNVMVGDPSDGTRTTELTAPARLFIEAYTQLDGGGDWTPWIDLGFSDGFSIDFGANTGGAHYFRIGGGSNNEFVITENKSETYGLASSTDLFVNDGATSTTLAITSITSALPLAAADGSLGEYAGASCTNQFVRSLNGAGAATCADVVLATDTTGNFVATVTSSGSITVANSGTENAAVTVNLNMGNANSWTALQTFANATTTLLSANYASSTLWYGGGLADTCASGSFLTWTAGQFGCDTDDTTAGAGDFSFETTYSTLSAATSSALWLQSFLFASSTAYFSDEIHLPAVAGTATSTILGDLQIGSSIGDNKVRITADRVFSASNSAGGLLNLTNTTNTGPALVIYTNQASSAGNLVNVRCDNASQAHDCFKIDHDGAGDGLAIAATAAASNALSLSNTGLDHTLNVAYTGTTAAKGALNLTSTNDDGSVFQIAGDPVGLGVGKITHNGVGDADSSVLSLAASNTGYLGLGLFIDIETAGTQKILNLRSDGVERFTLDSTGLASTTDLVLSSINSAILLAGSTGNVGAYAGTSCTNQLVRSLNGAGVATCEDVVLATDTTGNFVATVTSSGSITVANSGTENAAVTVNLNMGNANTWTALQTFANSSTTLGSFNYASSTLWYGGGLQTCDATTGKLTWSNGVFDCGTDFNTGGGGDDPFTHTSFGGLTTSATTSLLHLTNTLGLAATSTFANFATSSQFTLGAYGSNVGIYFTEDGDGALTVQGIGNGNNQSFTLNLDDTAGAGVFSSGSLTAFDFTQMRGRWDGLVIDGDGTYPASADGSLIIGDGTDTGGIELEDGGMCIGDGGCTQPGDGSLTVATDITTPALFASSNDSGALGASGTAFSDLFLASGGVINWLGGDVTLTHSAGVLTLSTGDKLVADYASTTAITASGTASSTALVVSNLNAASCDVKASTAGVLSCGTDSEGSAAFPWTPTTYSGVAVNATSTGLWLQATSPFSMVASSTFVSNASSTQLTNTGSTWLASLTSAGIITDAAGLLAEYAGTSCTNEFVRYLYALIVATCAAVDLAADVTGTLPVANGGTGATTLTDGGVLLGSGTGAITPMAVLADGSIIVGDGTTDPVALAAFESSTGDLAVTAGGTGVGTLTDGYPLWGNGTSDIEAVQPAFAVSYASTTQGVGTSTQRIGVAPYAITVNTARCDFSNFMGVSLYDGTNRANYFEASSTVGTITFSTNNTFTQYEPMRVDYGTSTSIGSDVRGGCTFFYTK